MNSYSQKAHLGTSGKWFYTALSIS